MPELEPITREEKFLNGEVGMTPITREEKILAGEDIETVTRREYFLKKYRGGGGGDITVEEITITENGTTTAPSGKAYSPIHTNVPQPTLSTLEVSENGDYDAPSGTAYNRVEVNVPLPENAYLLKSVANLPQAIASFSDGAVAPMKSLKVAIEPQQDLHGYDSPWVGGAGKNKFDISNTASTAEDNNGNPASVYGTKTNDTLVFEIGLQEKAIYYEIPSVGFAGDTQITISADVLLPTKEGLTSGGIYVRMKKDLDNTTRIEGQTTVTIGTKTHISVTLNAVANVNYNKFAIQPTGNSGVTTGLNCQVSNIQIELGSTATTFAPYSNICPISGWTEANITRTGKNFYSATLADYSSAQIAEVGLATFYPVKVPYGTYTISTNAPTGYIWAGYNIYDSSTLPRVYEGNPNTITTDIIWVGLLTSDMSSAYAYNIMINQGSTPSSYEPYAGTTYTIDLDGTRYGGELDVVNGVCKPYKEYDSYNGETLVGPWMSDRDVYAEGTTPTIGAQVVDMGAYDTDVATQPTAITTLLGDNNISADTGNVLEGEYFSKGV